MRNDYVVEGRIFAPETRQSDFDDHGDCCGCSGRAWLVTVSNREDFCAGMGSQSQEPSQSVILAEPGSG